MEFILEMLFDILFSIFFRWPAAFVRWMFTGFRRPFIEVLEHEGDIIGTIGVVVLVGGGVFMLVSFKKMVINEVFSTDSRLHVVSAR
jgi:hypothetical protein